MVTRKTRLTKWTKIEHSILALPALENCLSELVQEFRKRFSARLGSLLEEAHQTINCHLGATHTVPHAQGSLVCHVDELA